jgi:hypothetical protein
MATIQETKQAYNEWQAYREALKKSTTIDRSESFGEKQARIKRLEADDEAWFAYYFQSYCTAPPAPFHKKAARRIMNTPEWFECRCWSRELAKSTRTMMEVLKLTLTSKKNNVILVSNSEDNAIRLLEPYRAQLDSNQRIINDYGVQKMTGKWTDSEFKTKKGVAFRAIGAGQSPRGTRNEAIRPNVILIDDIDTDADCLNPEIIKKKVDWIFDALIPTRSISVPLLIIASGNIIAEYCCMTEMAKKADKVDIINIRTDGKSSWPEKNTEEHIDRVLSIMPYSSMMKEYFNAPMTSGRIFKSLTFDNIPPLASMEQLVVYGDPSTSNRESKNSSFKVVALLGRKKENTYIIKVFCKQCGQADFIQAYYDMYAIVATAGCTAQYFMECNSLQEGFFESFYDPEFKRISRRLQVPVFIKKDDRPKANKFTRIEATLEPPNRLGWLIFNKKEKENPYMDEAVGQFKAVAPAYGGAIDAPDCIEGGYKILDKKGGMALNNYRYQKRSSRRY